MDYPAENACPHGGWYNGNPKLMIENGTFADYRHRLVEWVRKGKMQQADLTAFDKQWDKLTLEEKRARRNGVIEAIKKVPVRQRDGKIEYKSKPSDNGRGNRGERAPQLRRQLSHRQPLGSIDTRPDPLAGPSSSAPSGREVPDAVRHGAPALAAAV
jgi:hypothetical protein